MVTFAKPEPEPEPQPEPEAVASIGRGKGGGESSANTIQFKCIDHAINNLFYFIR